MIRNKLISGSRIISNCNGSIRASYSVDLSQAPPMSQVRKNEDNTLTITFAEDTFKGHGLEAVGIELPRTATTNRNELLTYFEQMTKIRRLEMAADALYKSKFIRGFCHLYIGQEAICSGVEAALTTPRDWIITSYRQHGWQYLRSGSATGVLAELTGRIAGTSKGKGGSMHMYDVEKGFWGGHGIVGAQVPLGAGLAFGQKYQNTGGVTMAMYGDGAANQGQIAEAMNMAKLWKLPVLFTCENNKYGMGTSIERASASTEFYARGDYCPGIQINAMNALAVREGTRVAAEYARKNGPIVLEFVTYRYQGHSMSDPGTTYRTRDEVKSVREKRDPISYVKALLLDFGLGTADDIKEAESRAKIEIDNAVEESKTSPFPNEDYFATDVLLESKDPIRGCDQSLQYVPK